MESDEIAAAAMIRSQDKMPRGQLSESALNVARLKSRAIPTDGDNFVISKLRDSFDGVLEPPRETPADLAVNVQPGTKHLRRRREKMNVDLRRNLRGKVSNAK